MSWRKSKADMSDLRMKIWAHTVPGKIVSFVQFIILEKNCAGSPISHSGVRHVEQSRSANSHIGVQQYHAAETKKESKQNHDIHFEKEIEHLPTEGNLHQNAFFTNVRPSAVLFCKNKAAAAASACGRGRKPRNQPEKKKKGNNLSSAVQELRKRRRRLWHAGAATTGCFRRRSLSSGASTSAAPNRYENWAVSQRKKSMLALSYFITSSSNRQNGQNVHFRQIVLRQSDVSKSNIATKRSFCSICQALHNRSNTISRYLQCFAFFKCSLMFLKFQNNFCENQFL